MKLKDEEKELRIKEVTLELVSEKGLAGVKMATVARMAELSPSTLYVYYSSKEDLLKAIFRDTMELFLKNDLGVSIEDTPYKTQIELMYRKILGFKQHKVKEHHFIKQFFTSPYFDQELQEEMKDVGVGFMELIEYGRKQMILKDKINIDVLKAVLDGMTEKLVEYHQKGKIKLDEKTVEEAFQVIWDGMKQ